MPVALHSGENMRVRIAKDVEHTLRWAGTRRPAPSGDRSRWRSGGKFSHSTSGGPSGAITTASRRKRRGRSWREQRSQCVSKRFHVDRIILPQLALQIVDYTLALANLCNAFRF